MNARRNHKSAEQLGFDALLTAADSDNRARENARAYAHLPGTMQEAVPFLRGLIDVHHMAMVEGRHAGALAIQEEAHRLAEKLNNYEPGIIADADSPGCMLDRATRAPKNTIPLWGQSGSFEIKVGAMRIRIAIDGMFGIGSCFCAWPGFSAHAIEHDKPFLSETGYRSFLGLHAELPPGQTPDSFARLIIETHIRHELKGKLLAIKPEYRSKARAAP